MLLNIFIGLLGLSIVVIVHEYGHLIFAKVYRVGVEVFSVGWGRKLIGKKIGNTEYRIAMIPIGGYVKLSGMNLLDFSYSTRKPNDNTDHTGLFSNLHPIKRMVVAFGGPLANIVFAFLIFMLLNSISYSDFLIPNKIVNASVLDGIVYPGEQGGLKNGDIIIEIDGVLVDNFSDIQHYVQNSRAGQERALVVMRDGRQHVIDIASTDTDSDRLIGIYPWVEPVVMDVNPDSVAATIGIQASDRIAVINDIPVQHSIDISATLQSIDRIDIITVVRDGERVVLEYPEDSATANLVGDLGVMYVHEIVSVSPKAFFASIIDSLRSIANILTASIQGILSLFSTEQQIENVVAGPIQITSIIGGATLNATGLGVWSSVRIFLNLTALISIAIAIMNLLPIPILDGGQIVLYLLELMIFKRLTTSIVKVYQLIGYGIILLLLGISIFSDLSFVLR